MTDAIGIFGGTFDPIHCGHLRTALEVAEYFNLHSVRFIPSAKPPHRKPPLASAAARLKLVECAISCHQQFVADDREMRRQGKSYTLDTLIDLRATFSDAALYFLMGSDSFLQIDTWHNWQQLVDLAHIIVIKRPGQEWKMAPQLSDWYHHHLAVHTDSRLLAGKIWPISVTQLAVSATAIRGYIAKGKNVQYLLPDTVIKLIDELGLYQKQQDD